MEIENGITTEKPARFSFSKRNIIFFLVLCGLIGGGILRSSIATRLDSFTIDEGYHIGAGVAYIQTGDFRLNREHPPLVKLWVGAYVSDILIALAAGSSYGGIRHALPVVPPLSLLASLAIYKAVESKSYVLRGVVAVTLIAALASAIPVLRPWEYYNETVGGSERAFSDEGFDAEQRVK